MNSKDREVLLKILKHIYSILKYCDSCEDLMIFEKDSMRVEACVFNMMQIGELTKHSLSDEFKNQIVNIPWKQLYGMRNRIVHGYDGVDMSVVWDTIKEDMPILKIELEDILK